MVHKPVNSECSRQLIPLRRSDLCVDLRDALSRRQIEADDSTFAHVEQ